MGVHSLIVSSRSFSKAFFTSIAIRLYVGRITLPAGLRIVTSISSKQNKIVYLDFCIDPLGSRGSDNLYEIHYEPIGESTEPTIRRHFGYQLANLVPGYEIASSVKSHNTVLVGEEQ
jgi:hypothetical protein